MEHSDKAITRKRLDPVKTRETISEAAFHTFAELGYEGASIGDIAKAAGVPKSLVQYHFGSKEDLWAACIKAKGTPMMEAVDRFLNTEAADPRDLISARFKFLKENPEVRRLLCWAGMTPGPMPSFILERRNKVLQKFGRDTSGEKLTRFLAALAATDGWFLFRNFYRGPFGESVFDEELERRLLETLLEMVIEK